MGRGRGTGGAPLLMKGMPASEGEEHVAGCIYTAVWSHSPSYPR